MKTQGITACPTRFSLSGDGVTPLTITAFSLGTSTSRIPKLAGFQPGQNLSGQRKRLLARRSITSLFETDTVTRFGREVSAGVGWLDRTVPATQPSTKPETSFTNTVLETS